MPAVAGVAAWRRSKGGQMLPGAAESETGAGSLVLQGQVEAALC